MTNFQLQRRTRTLCASLVVLVAGCATAAPATEPTQGWLSWRGPAQNGTSTETNLPTDLSVDGADLLWSVPISGGGAPVAEGDRVCTFGYRGEGADLQEVLSCRSRATGALIWEHAFSDFLSDIIYERYGIGSPTIDAETGNTYLMTSNGVIAAFSKDGTPLWRHSMMEKFGRLTFPNGRTGAPLLVDDLVIVRGIVTSWGRLGPARDRFYAFQKDSGALVWVSTPGVRPFDSSFSTPVVGTYGDQRVFYAGTGCGNVVCIRLDDGKPLWRFQLSQGGVNASVLLHGERVLAIHGKENLDSSQTGRLVSIKAPAEPPTGAQAVLDSSHEVWRADMGHFTSSGVLHGDTLYQMLPTGVLVAVDANSGKTLWRKKLGSEQLHASPLYADGKLYIPLREGQVYVLKPGEKGVEEISSAHLDGSCLGAPSVYGGQIFIQTTRALYAFGKPGTAPARAAAPGTPEKKSPGLPARLSLSPAEVFLRAGEEQKLTVWQVDARGTRLKALDPTAWSLTKSKLGPLGLTVDSSGILRSAQDAKQQAQELEVTAGELKGRLRLRVFPALPYREDFESAELQPHPKKSDVNFSHPPAPWIGAKLKWEVRDLEGKKVLRKTLDRLLFQRATTFVGPPEMQNYTVQADVMSDGNRRGMSTVGVVNQRYVVALKGNWQQLEVSSNYDRIQVGVPFSWKPNTWYRIKTRVDISEDGSGVVRAKAWRRDEPEPEKWLLEVPHKQAHRNGAPGIFGFSPQAQFPVFVDNLVIEHNE